MPNTYLRYIENEVAKYQRRIKKIKENPDPTKLRSNLVLYELELEQALGELEDARVGKPFAFGAPTALLSACGFIIGGGLQAADRTAQGEGNTRYLDILRNEGWPELACDRTVVSILLVTSDDYPAPDFISVCNLSCEFSLHNAMALAQLKKIPYFAVDIGNEADEENLKYVTDQLKEEIEYVEKHIPKAKYNEEILLQMQEYDRQGAHISREIYEFRKRRPSPINPRDAQREVTPVSGRPLRVAKKAIEYLTAQRDEMFERAEKGVGVMKEERLRFLWCTIGVNYDEEIYRWLETQGVAIYYVYGMNTHQLGLSMGYYGDLWKGRKLTPLEEEARYVFYNSWNGTGQRLINDWMFVAKDQGVDGVIYTLQSGCLPTLNLRKLFTKALEKEGIPTLGLEIRGIFKEGYNREDVKAKLSNFIEICLDKKRARMKSETK